MNKFKAFLSMMLFASITIIGFNAAIGMSETVNADYSGTGGSFEESIQIQLPESDTIYCTQSCQTRTIEVCNDEYGVCTTAEANMCNVYDAETNSCALKFQNWVE